MKKNIKKILIGFSLSALGLLAFKLYKFIREAIELEKMLPQYLKTQFGEKPEINLSLHFGTATLTATFTKETLQQKDLIEQEILDYVGNYYPCFQKHKIKVVLAEKVEVSPSQKEQKLKENIQRAEERIEALNNDSSKASPKSPTKKTSKKNTKTTSEKTKKSESKKKPKSPKKVQKKTESQ
jgi:hypothetical protein